MKAVGHYIIIERLKEEEKPNKYGLVLNDRQKDDVRWIKGKVITPGTEVKAVSEGDVIFFDKHAGHYLPGDEKLIVIEQRDVAVIL